MVDLIDLLLIVTGLLTLLVIFKEECKNIFDEAIENMKEISYVSCTNDINCIDEICYCDKCKK